MVLNAAIEGWEAAWKLQEDILKRQAQQDLMIGGSFTDYDYNFEPCVVVCERRTKTMSNYIICKNCEFCFDQDGFCHCEDAPPTDFIKGKRYLYAANARGECRWFRAKSEETGGEAPQAA